MVNVLGFVSAFPDTLVADLTPDHEFIVLACDGIWDVLTNQEVVDFIRARIAQRMLPEIVSTVCLWCIYHHCPVVSCFI
jgi:protein phosphatase 2C family protein 2/3